MYHLNNYRIGTIVFYREHIQVSRSVIVSTTLVSIPIPVSLDLFYYQICHPVSQESVS